MDGFELEGLSDNGIVYERTISLVHVHLPKLAESGFITWDRESNRVTKGPDFEAPASILDHLENNDAIPCQERGL